jgi:predicted dehydrogenase
LSEKVRWGVLGAAKIAVEKVVPAMQRGEWSEVSGLASRDAGTAARVARELGIAKSYGSYEGLLDDPSIEAVYIPLPNHMHVPWALKAAEAGKHVLCEKPIAMDAAGARHLIDARERTGVKIQEAFMVRTHPQWTAARELVRSGRIGHLRSIESFFSYFNRDPSNIRNIPAAGGGALLDIGCYPVQISRFVYDAEPRRVFGLIERDPELKTDRLTSAILDFEAGRAAFTCSTQLVPHQRVELIGTRGRVEIEVPFNTPPDQPTRIFVDDGSALGGAKAEAIEVAPCDQYTIQGDLFSRAIREGTAQPIPLEDAVNNMAVIDAVFRSAESGCWETPE